MYGVRTAWTATIGIAGALTLTACGSGGGDDGSDDSLQFRPVTAAALTQDTSRALPAELEDHEAAEWFLAGDCAAPKPTGEDYVAACSADGSEIFLLGPSALDGSDVDSAEVDHDDDFGDSVNLTLTNAGTQALADLTSEAIEQPAPRNRIAIEVDGAVMAAPTVRTAVTDGSISVVGSGRDDSVQAIADAID